MKQRALILVVLGMITFPLSAQAQNLKVSFDAGVSNSVLNSDVSNLINTRYNTRAGVVSRVNLEYNFYEDFIVVSGVGFVQKSYDYCKTDNVTGTRTTYRNNFINIPLYVGLYLFNNPHNERGVWLKIQGGVFYEYLAGMRRNGVYPVFSELQKDGRYELCHVSEKYDFDKNENHLKRGLFGLEGKAEFGYSFTKFDVFASYAYQYGLTDIYKAKTSANSKSRRVANMITLGVAYKF